MAREYVLLYHDYLEQFSGLTHEEMGRLMRAGLVFSRGGDPDSLLTGNERLLYPLFRQAIIRDARSYRARCIKNRQSALKRWHDKELSPEDEELLGSLSEDEPEAARIEEPDEIEKLDYMLNGGRLYPSKIVNTRKA